MNRKGFTLTELLVVVVLLGIISGISIPLIRNLTSTFEKKKYQSYADSVLSAAKIYNDSYSEDLFGHNDYGCAYISYDKLVEKKLIKDIEVEEMSCNSDKTYVRVIKQNDKYGYAVYVSCGKKTNGKITATKVSIPTTIPDMNNEVCTGTNPSKIVINAVEAQTNGDADKNRKKAKIELTSNTGINNNMVIYAKWSKVETDYTTPGYEKVSFKIPGNQEEKLLNGQTITTKSNELITPKDNGDYYLIVRVDRLEDLQGHPWQNPREAGSKYITFGPFRIDNTTPIVVAAAYKCDASRKKTGEAIVTPKTHTGAQTLYDLSSMTNNVDGWANLEHYPNGICFEFNLSDNEGLGSYTWEWNADGQSGSVTDYKGFSSSRKSTDGLNKATTATITKSLTTDGHRYARLTVKDMAGNKTVLDIDLKLDRVAPRKPTITNPSNGIWTNQSITLTMGSSDRVSTSSSDTTGVSEMGKYYYTYNSDASTIGTNDKTEWVILTKGNNLTSFSDTWNAERNSTVYIEACDKAGNCSAKANTALKIDKTPPVITTNVYKRDENGNKADNTILLSNTTTKAANSTNLFNIPGSVGGWLNKANFPYGVYFDFSISDNFTLNTRKWEYNTKGIKDSASGYNTLNGGSSSANLNTTATTATYSNYFSADGHRYGRLTITDKAGNSAYIDIQVKLDKVAPNSFSFTNSSGGGIWGNQNIGKWTNADKVTISMSSDDALSGMGEYYYTYSDSASSIGSNTSTEWVNIANGSGKTSSTVEWTEEINKVVYIRSCDKAGNCVSKQQTNVKIDRTKPTCGDAEDASGWETDGADAYVECTDSGTYASGCVESAYLFEELTESQYKDIKDNAGNKASCWIPIESKPQTVCYDQCWQNGEASCMKIGNYDQCNENCRNRNLTAGSCPESGHYMQGYTQMSNGCWGYSGGTMYGPCWSGCDMATGGVDICHPYIYYEGGSEGYYYPCDCHDGYAYRVDED